MGNVKRLTIATMVDLSVEGEAAKPNMTMVDVQDIVKQAIGFQQGRDEIKVSDVKLAAAPIPIAEVNEDIARLQRVHAYVGLARNVSLTVALVVTVGLAVLLLARRQPRPKTGPSPAEKAAEEERQRREIQRFEEMARKEPDKVASILSVLVGAPAQ